MKQVCVFGDESGNLDFARRPGASQHFIIATVTTDGYELGDRILDLRRQLSREGVDVKHGLHATEDSEEVRQRVFEILETSDFRIDATVFEKSKAQPRLYSNDSTAFMKFAWFYHLKFVAPRVARSEDSLEVIAASFGTRKKLVHFQEAIDDVISQVSPCTSTVGYCVPSSAEPCLQVADYCAWAIYRKWESKNTRHYDRIARNVRSEFSIFRTGATEYY